jgi:hypothetical protein
MTEGAEFALSENFNAVELKIRSSADVRTSTATARRPP